MSFQSPFTLGDLELPNNIFYAPLAGCSDFPYRQMPTFQKVRPGLLFCEMVKMDALIRYDRKTFRLLDYSADLHPIGAQLCGSNPSYAADSARILEDLGFDVIDFNCGCPVDKVTKDGSGSGMLKTPELIGEILNRMTLAVSVPITVKIRAGWDDDSINAVEIMKIAESAGAKIITIHGRTREQAYKGEANWDYIKAAKQQAKSIKVFGNGDVFTAIDAKRMFDETLCDGIVVARGTMGRPSIANEIYELYQNKESNSFNAKKALLDHLALVEKYQPESRGLVELRKVGAWYFKNNPDFKYLKKEIVGVTSLSEAKEILDKCL